MNRHGTAAAALLLLLTLAAAPRVATAADEPAGHGGNPAAAVESTADHADGTHGAGAGDHGKPSLLNPINTGLVTSLTTLIVFLALLAILGKYAWGPIAGGLKAREDKIRQDIADADAARARAEATLRDYNAQLAGAETRIREMLAKATADGEAIATNIRARAQQDAEETKERANRDIEAARDQAIGQIHGEAVNLATNIAEKILQRNLNPDDQRDLLARSLDQVQGIGRN